MSRTNRWWNSLKIIFNPYWFRHDCKAVRIKGHRDSRHLNKVRLKKGLDVENENKTRGRDTW